MRPDSKTTGPATSRLLLGLVMSFVAFSVVAQTVRIVPANIFGDGNPINGIEDSREQFMGGRGRGTGLADQRPNAGTIKCDGKIRGTAMVVDTREFAPGFEGVVLASAAHVIYDLKKNRRFKRCEFHFLALSELRRRAQQGEALYFVGPVVHHPIDSNRL